MRILSIAVILGLAGCTSSSSTVDQSVETGGSDVHATKSAGSAADATDVDDALVVLDRETPLDNLIASKETVLVDFYATWCGPCQKLGNTLHELQAFAANNNARIVKVNVDEHQDVARQFQITRLPTVVLFKSGTQKDRHVGGLSGEEVKELIRL